MKFDYETGKGIKMSSKKKKTGAKSKPTEAAVFNEARSIGQNSGKIDNDSQGYSSSGVLEMAPFAERDRFSDGSWPKDGYGKAANLGGPQTHFNNFMPRFSGVGHYARNNEDGEPIHMMRSEHYPGYDRGKGGFISNQAIVRHGPESHLGMLPPRPGFAGAAGPGLTHGYGTNPPSSCMPHGQQASGIQQTYSSATPMLTQLLRYPNPSDKFQPGQVDEYRASGPPKSWMENMTLGINQNIYPPRPTMPFYDQRPMNQTHSNQISVIPVQASSHGSQGQLQSGSGPPGNSGAFAPPPYVQCNPPAPATYRLEANDRCTPQHQQRSSSQSRPMSSTSSSLGSPNNIRPISPVPTAAMSAQSHQLEKKGGAAQKTSSASRPKKCKDEVNNIQDISSCDEGGSDSSSSTEVYSQITPMSTPSTTPLPPQSGGTKPSPPGSDESLSNTPVPAVGTGGMAPSSGLVPGTLTLSSSSSFTGASSMLGASQSLDSSSSYGSHVGGSGAPTLSGLKADHLRATNPCSTYDVVGSKSYSCSQMQVSPMTAFNSQYSSNYGPGNYSRTPGTPQQLYRPQGHPNQYGGPSQMYGSAGPPSMHPSQPCGNYPYPGPSKVSPGQYVQGHSQAVPPSAGMHHQMEVENTVSGGVKGYGVPGGMYGPGKMGVQPAPGQMVNANMQSVHCHSTGLGQSNPPHPSQFGKTGYGTPFNAGLGNGIGPPHHQHMVPYPAPPYGGHGPAAHQMHHYSQRPMMSPVPHGTSGSNMADHGSMRPTSPAFYRGGPVGYESEGPGNGPGRSQWVMNMQGMFGGGRVVEAQHGENIPVDMPPVTIPAAGEIQRMRSAPTFEPAMAKERLSASPISSSDYTSAESKSGDLAIAAKQIEQPKIENDFSMASSLDSHGRSLMSPGLMPSKSVDLDLVKKDIGSDSNSLPGHDRSRVDSDKQETLSSPPSTPLNHLASSPASLERDISSPCVQSSKSSGNSSVFNKIAEMGSEQDRGIFLERLFSFMSYRGTPVTAVPVICKQTVDLYRLYHLVRERGGMVDVTKNKKWREVSTSLNLGASSSAGFTLKRNYAKFLFPFECRYDRGNIDPGPIIMSMEMSSKKETKKNSDRSVDMDNCRPPSNQSYCGYPVGGSLPHGMPASDIPGCGMHQGMMGQSPSPYNGGMGSGAVGVGRSGMMSPVGMSQNHSSLSRGSTESSLASGQDSVSIQDPFHDVPVGPGPYPASHSTVNSQLSMYGGLTEHTPPPPAAGPGTSYEHRSSVPPQSAPSVYNNPANQCISSPAPGSGGQGNNGFGDLCAGSRARPMNEAGFGNHLMHVGEYGGGGSGYGNGVSAQDPNVGCLPPGDRFDGSQSGYPGSMPVAKHSSQAESHITNDQSYYGHYSGQVPGAPSQRYQSGYDPHFYGASNQPAMPGYPGPQKIAAPGMDSFTQQNHPGEGPMMGHPMGPPHPPVPYQMQKSQVPGVMGGIPKGDVYDYQAAPHVNRPEAVWMQHQFGQHYPPQPYPGSHVMHPNAGPVRGPYGMYSRFPAQSIKKYDVEKQRGVGGPHYLSPSRDVAFPPGSVEATRPKLTKRRKLTHRDMGSVDAWRLMMALRSGLITESTWALDVLTILLRDDVTAPCLSLSHMPGLLEVLVEQYRRCLILIFGGDFEELEVSSEMQSIYAASVHAVDSHDVTDEEETKALPDPKSLAAPGNYTLKTRDGKTIGIESDSDEMLLDRKTWDVFKEFESSAFDWQMGRGDMTLHIITNLLSRRSPDFHREKYFGMHYESMKKKSNPSQKEEKKNGDELSVGDASISADKVVSQSVGDDLLKSGHDVPLVSKSTEVNSSTVVSSNGCSSEDGASNMPDSDVLMQESAPCNSGEAESKVEMDFDNFDNNQFTCTQLELLKRSCSELDEETYRPNDGVYCRLTDYQLEISQRCLCLSNIFRNLSFISGNDIEICKHNGLMLILGKLLLLNHKHLPRSARRLAAMASTGDATDPADPASSPTEAEFLFEEIGDQNKEWWWNTLQGLRENTLVVFANICGQLDLSSFPEEICLPVLNGLLHWLVCSSAEALDSLAASSLSPQRLVLEALCKLCVTDTNIDLVLATPPFSRIVLLITNLARMLSEHQQVVREFAVGLLSCLVPGDNSVSRALALHHPSVTLLIEFIEDAEHHAAQVVNAHGPVVLRDNPEIMGTSLDMLCRVATILHHLVDVPENVPLISRHQERLLKLIMSPVLDRSVTAILADVLSSCS